MKKTYITPEMLSVALNTETCVLQAVSSLPINTGGGEGGTIGESGEILTKESKNVWDEEW